MMDLIKIIKEEVQNFSQPIIRGRIFRENYEDIGMDYIINREKKLNQYHDFTNKKVVGDVTYLNFLRHDDWHLWGEIKAFDNVDGTEIGNVSYGKPEKGDLMKASIDVRPDKRRTGIASTMYSWIEQLTGNTLYPDTPHSDSAAKLWGNPNRKFGSK